MRHRSLWCDVGPIVKLIDFKRLTYDKGITYSRNYLRRTVKTKEFPAPISVSDHRIGWDERRFTSGDRGRDAAGIAASHRATTPPAMAAPRATIAKSSLAVQVVAGARLGEAALGIKATLD